jgi:hypothetical protein
MSFLLHSISNHHHHDHHLIIIYIYIYVYQISYLGGCFYNDCQLSEAHNHATNPIYAEKLWELSLACINIK